MTDHAAHPLLPHAAPASADLRLILYGIRRMAAGGLADAHAAHAFFTAYGISYRRPLVLLRGFVGEIARTGAARLAIGPCCCPRMSSSEQAILSALGSALGDPAATHGRLARLLQVRSCPRVLDQAIALAGCFEDFGRPLPRAEDACT